MEAEETRAAKLIEIMENKDSNARYDDFKSQLNKLYSINACLSNDKSFASCI